MSRLVKYGVLSAVLFGLAPIENSSAGDFPYPETTLTEQLP